MLVTADTSHTERSRLKNFAFSKMKSMLVTADTSQDVSGPCGSAKQSPVGDILEHALKASRSSVLFAGANVAAISTSKAFGVSVFTDTG